MNFRASETVLSAEDGGLTYGWSVATVGNKVYVGSRASQKVYEYAKTGGNYNLISEIVPGEEAVDFGTYLSVSGSWMAGAAPDFFGDQGGKVFMFKKQGNAWVQQAVLTSSSARSFGGNGVVLKGNTLAVGSAALGGVRDPEGSPISVFELNGNNWTLSETIRQPGNDFFEIDMDDEGNRIVGTGALNGSGAFIWASIFVREASGWAFEDQVVAPFGSGFLARDVAIHNNTVVITAVVPGNKYFVCTNEGGDWEITQELIGTSLPPQNRFVDMSEEKIVVGAASFINSISDEVQIFEKSGGTWSLTEVLTMGDNGADKRIWSVAISGNTIVAGLPGSGFPPVPPGSASVFD